MNAKKGFQRSCQNLIILKSAVRAKYDQTRQINRDLKTKTNDSIYIEIYIVEVCKNLIEFKNINTNISELRLRFRN